MSPSSSRLSAALLVVVSAVLSGAGCSGCGGPPTVGGFVVESTEGGGFVIRGRDGERVLLRSYEGGDGAYAPVALRANKARYELMYGSWRISEGNAPWTTGARLEGAVDGDHWRGEWKTGDGAVVGTMELTSPSEGVLELRVRSADEAMNRTSLAFACEESDHFLGFGAQADGVDHRGHTIPVWTSEPGIGKSASDEPPELWMLEGARHASSYGLPTWLSNRGFIGVVDGDARSVFELCSVREDAFRVETWERELRLRVYDGPTPKEALTRATGDLLGRPPRPPPVAFAPWNDAIYGEANVRAIAQLLRDNDVPSSVLWTEDFRGGEDRGEHYRLIEEWDLDRSLYPKAEELAAELRALGFSWHAYFNTFVVTDTRIWDAAVAGGHLVRDGAGQPYEFEGVTFKPTGLADLSKPETREWVKTYLRAALDVGFDGWMADYGEWLPHDAVLASGEDPLLAHNRYAREWVKLNAEVLAERPADGRQLLFFARAGWLGSTAFTPVVWAGDQRTDFQRDDGLPTVIPMGLNLGLAGVSTYGHDIAGYQSSTNPPSTQEVFFRWTTLGALSPVMRTHHGLSARDNWWFGKDAETLAHFARWARLHIRLFPYLDGASVEAETSGIPLMRALALEFPGDEAAWTAADSYLLGPSLLVAPVVEQGKTSRAVRLPEGRWYRFESGEAFEGPKEIVADAPMSELPIFGRAGTVVPLLPEDVDTLLPAEPPTVDLADAEGRRVLLVFSGAEGSFAERDGTSYRLIRDEGAESALREAGEALPVCAEAQERGCVEPATDGQPVRVRLTAQGPLSWGNGRLEVSGPARQLDVVLYR